jgi:hypothetical protein
VRSVSWPSRPWIRASGAKLAGGPHKVGIAAGWLPAGQQESVLKADSGVDATAYRILDQGPGRLAVAVLESRGPYLRPVQDFVDGTD